MPAVIWNPVRVAVRCRPVQADEDVAVAPDASDPSSFIVNCDDSHRSFSVGGVLGAEATQEDVYSQVGVELVEATLDGIDSTLFAFGPSGSGKSYSIFGSVGDPEQSGLIPRICQGIFQEIEGDGSVTCACSFLEVRAGRVRDLLMPNQEVSACWREVNVQVHPELGIVVPGVSEATVSSAQDVVEAVTFGYELRAVDAAALNMACGRSYVVFRLHIVRKVGAGLVRRCSLQIIDLAACGIRHLEPPLSRLRDGLSSILEQQAQQQNPGDISVVDVAPCHNLELLLWGSLFGYSSGRVTVLVTVHSSLERAREACDALAFASEMKCLRVRCKNSDEPVPALNGLVWQIKDLMLLWDRHRQQLGLSRGRLGDGSEDMPAILNIARDPALTGCLRYHLPLGCALLIGASAECSVPLPGLSMSPHMCHIEYTSHFVMHLVPLEEDNGNYPAIFVNGQRVRGRVRLRHNDRLVFGELYGFHLVVPHDSHRQLSSVDVEKLTLTHLLAERDCADEERATIARIIQHQLPQGTGQFLAQLGEALSAVAEATAITSFLRPGLRLRKELVWGLGEGRLPTLWVSCEEDCSAHWHATALNTSSGQFRVVWRCSVEEFLQRLEHMREGFFLTLLNGGCPVAKDDTEDPWAPWAISAGNWSGSSHARAQSEQIAATRSVISTQSKAIPLLAHTEEIRKFVEAERQSWEEVLGKLQTTEASDKRNSSEDKLGHGPDPDQRPDTGGAGTPYSASRTSPIQVVCKEDTKVQPVGPFSRWVETENASRAVPQRIGNQAIVSTASTIAAPSSAARVVQSVGERTTLASPAVSGVRMVQSSEEHQASATSISCARKVQSAGEQTTLATPPSAVHMAQQAGEVTLSNVTPSVTPGQASPADTPGSAVRISRVTGEQTISFLAPPGRPRTPIHMAPSPRTASPPPQQTGAMSVPCPRTFTWAGLPTGGSVVPISELPRSGKSAHMTVGGQSPGSSPSLKQAWSMSWIDDRSSQAQSPSLPCSPRQTATQNLQQHPGKSIWSWPPPVAQVSPARLTQIASVPALTPSRCSSSTSPKSTPVIPGAQVIVRPPDLKRIPSPNTSSSVPVLVQSPRQGESFCASPRSTAAGTPVTPGRPWLSGTSSTPTIRTSSVGSCSPSALPQCYPIPLRQQMATVVRVQSMSPPRSPSLSPRLGQATISVDSLSPTQLSSMLQNLRARPEQSSKVLLLGAHAPKVLESIMLAQSEADRLSVNLLQKLECPNLTKLSLSLGAVFLPDVGRVSVVLREHRGILRCIEWSGRPNVEAEFCTTFFAELFSSLQCLVNLEIFALRDTEHLGPSPKLLGDTLVNLRRLKEIDFQGLQLGPQGIMMLTQPLAQCTSLRKLCLRCCGLQSGGGSHLAEWLCAYPSLTELNCAENHIDAAAAVELLAVVPLCANLSCMDLSTNAFATTEANGGSIAAEDHWQSVAAFWYSIRGQCKHHATILGI